ncbi:MAG: hypothetical protein IRZ08_15835 [Frankia sp.]|nr:hypothetical protein [Frankia sp.]
MPPTSGRRLAPADLAILAGAALMLAASFLPWLTLERVLLYHGSVRHRGWSAGLLAVLAILLVLAVGGLAAARLLAAAEAPALGPVGPALLAVLLSGVALLFVLLRLVTVTPYDPGIGIFLGLAGTALVTGASVARLLASGEQVPRPWPAGDPPA